MKNKEKKMTLGLMAFIIIVMIALFVYYQFYEKKDNNISESYKPQDIPLDIKHLDASSKLFKRKDFLELQQNSLIQQHAETNNEKDNLSKKFHATKRNPFKPF